MQVSAQNLQDLRWILYWVSRLASAANYFGNQLIILTEYLFVLQEAGNLFVATAWRVLGEEAVKDQQAMCWSIIAVEDPKAKTIRAAIRNPKVEAGEVEVVVV